MKEQPITTPKRTYPKRLSVLLSDEVKAQVEVLASQQRRSMSEMAALLIEKSLQTAKQATDLDPLLN